MIERFETERLALRPISLGDVDDLVALDSDPEVMRYISGGLPSSREDVVAAIRTSLCHRWIATTRATSALVGWFALRPPDDVEALGLELGYRLFRTAWGHGYAVEGSRALIDRAFSQLGIRRVWAQTMAVNVSSRHVMERCGMRHVRTFHLDWEDPIDGAEHGEVEYEVVKDEWAGA